MLCSHVCSGLCFYSSSVMHTSECCGVNHIRPDCTLHQHVWTTSKLVICAQIISNFKHACVCGVKILYISNLAVADEKKKSCYYDLLVSPCVWAGKWQLYILGSWHQKCAAGKSLWHSDTPSNIPRDKRMKPGRLSGGVPSTAIGPQENIGQPPAPMWVSITGFDRRAALLAALLHCPSGQSAPQLALRWWVMPSPSAACQKEHGATEEVQISSNGLDADGCAHDNRPSCLWFGCFVSEEHRDHHNNTAKLCMQTQYHWHGKEHCQLLW